MPDFLSFINEILWGSVMIYLLLGAGIWFSWQTRGIQFRYVRKFGRSLKKSLHPQPGGLTSFQALCTSLAARVGSGNLAGVTLAIAAGGPGAVFWMWVSALLGMASSFAECSLAQLYKERDSRGQFRGGVLAVVVLLAILRGLRGVARLMQWIVPFMALLWIATSLLIGLWHITALPTIFATIFRCAFGWQEAAAGAVGYTISQALTSGFQRGMFSNEAGMGSSPNAAAAAASWPPHPAAQGIVQMIGVFIDTIVICTASAIIVMLAPRPDNEYTLNGIQDLQHAMSVLVGGWGAGFIALIVLLFAFSSIVANYVYAENNLVFLRLDKPRYIWGLRILTVLMVLLGTMVSLPVVWQSADIIMALMAMTNLTAILLLSPTVRIIASDYLRQRRLGIQPTFDATRYPDIDQQLAPGAWNELPRE
ncbi:TPA: sodium:alanine symporter family protein [Klebsiella pneumoniae]|nr:sodium:alanine symporter family protein [Klebsiella pneumoniae]